MTSLAPSEPKAAILRACSHGRHAAPSPARPSPPRPDKLYGAGARPGSRAGADARALQQLLTTRRPEFVFCSERGTPLMPTTSATGSSRPRSDGPNPVASDDLRHTHISLLIAHSAHPNYIRTATSCHSPTKRSRRRPDQLVFHARRAPCRRVGFR